MGFEQYAGKDLYYDDSVSDEYKDTLRHMIDHSIVTAVLPGMDIDDMCLYLNKSRDIPGDYETCLIVEYAVSFERRGYIHVQVVVAGKPHVVTFSEQYVTGVLGKE